MDGHDVLAKTKYLRYGLNLSANPHSAKCVALEGPLQILHNSTVSSTGLPSRRPRGRAGNRPASTAVTLPARSGALDVCVIGPAPACRRGVSRMNRAT